MRLIRRVGLALVAALGLLACEPSASTRAEPGAEGAESPQAQVEAGALLLDVRTEGEFASGHIDGARNIPVQVLDGRMSELDPEVPIVVYCRSGARSASAASMLRAQGYEVTDLGAMSNWRD